MRETDGEDWSERTARIKITNETQKEKLLRRTNLLLESVSFVVRERVAFAVFYHLIPTNNDEKKKKRRDENVR